MAVTLAGIGRRLWGPHHYLAGKPTLRPTSVKERLQLLENELAVRDVLTTYLYWYDAGDLEGTISVFHEDCFMINRYGTWTGRSAIRSYYEHVISQYPVNFHLPANVMVRFQADRSALLTCYFQAINVGPTGLTGSLGMYADRLVDVDGKWFVRERRVTASVHHKLDAAAFRTRAKGEGPEPSSAETSNDWMAP